METLIGFVFGYIAGCKDGPDGVKRLTVEAVSFAEVAMRRAASGRGLSGLSGTVGAVTDALVHRASAPDKGPKAA